MQKGAGDKDLGYDWSGEILDLTEQNSKLNEDIRHRQDTIDKLVYRYQQSEQKVREFIKNTMRYE